MSDDEITAIVGWPTEPEMAKYRKVAAAAAAAAAATAAAAQALAEVAPDRMRALVMQCAYAVLAGHPTVTISVTGKRPEGWPRGELLSVGTDGTRNYAVHPLKILAWLHERSDAVAETERLRADRDCEKRLRKASDDLATDLRIALEAVISNPAETGLAHAVLLRVHGAND